MDSAMLLYCLRNAERERSSVKSKLGKLWTVFPPQISFMGRNVPFKMMGKIRVMLLYHLSRRLLRMWNLFFNYCFVRINIFWIYLTVIKHQRWWNFPTLFTISSKSVNSTSLLAPAMPTLTVFAVFHANPLKLYQRLSQIRI